MEEIPPYLFVYGTLLDTDNPYAIFLKENSRFYQHGRLRGKLFNIGNYPGAIIDDTVETFVQGFIFLMDNSNNVLDELDAYEGFGDGFAQPNEFIRALANIETDHGATIIRFDVRFDEQGEETEETHAKREREANERVERALERMRQAKA